MRDAEIERLLGGYATNTLTEAERQALFAAALDDQELFNALEDEQALRELLEDSGSRRLIAEALAAPEPAAPVSWFRKPWAWGALACAAAGLAIGFVLLQPPEPVAHQELATAKVDQTATQPAAIVPLQEPIPTPASKRPRKTVAPPADTLAFAPRQAIQSQPVQVAPAAPAAARASQPEAVQVQPAAPAPPQAAVGGFLAGAEAQFQPPSARIVYSVLHRGAGGIFEPLAAGESLGPGDSLKLRVEAPASGSLQVLEQDANGEWAPLYPAKGAVPVTAHQQYTIPDAPIPLGAGKHLRLVFASAPVATALRTGALEALARPKARLAIESETGRARANAAPGGGQAKSEAAAGPGVITTDIALAPGKPPQ